LRKALEDTALPTPQRKEKTARHEDPDSDSEQRYSRTATKKEKRKKKQRDRSSSGNKDNKFTSSCFIGSGHIQDLKNVLRNRASMLYLM